MHGLTILAGMSEQRLGNEQEPVSPAERIYGALQEIVATGRLRHNWMRTPAESRIVIGYGNTGGVHQQAHFTWIEGVHETGTVDYHPLFLFSDGEHQFGYCQVSDTDVLYYPDRTMDRPDQNHPGADLAMALAAEWFVQTMHNHPELCVVNGRPLSDVQQG
jgi:hypothetical protein